MPLYLMASWKAWCQELLARSRTKGEQAVYKRIDDLTADTTGLFRIVARIIGSKKSKNGNLVLWVCDGTRNSSFPQKRFELFARSTTTVITSNLPGVNHTAIPVHIGQSHPRFQYILDSYAGEVGKLVEITGIYLAKTKSDPVLVFDRGSLINDITVLSAYEVVGSMEAKEFLNAEISQSYKICNESQSPVEVPELSLPVSKETNKILPDDDSSSMPKPPFNLSGSLPGTPVTISEISLATTSQKHTIGEKVCEKKLNRKSKEKNRVVSHYKQSSCTESTTRKRLRPDKLCNEAKKRKKSCCEIETSSKILKNTSHHQAAAEGCMNKETLGKKRTAGQRRQSTGQKRPRLPAGAINVLKQQNISSTLPLCKPPLKESRLALAIEAKSMTTPAKHKNREHKQLKKGSAKPNIKPVDIASMMRELNEKELGRTLAAKENFIVTAKGPDPAIKGTPLTKLSTSEMSSPNRRTQVDRIRPSNNSLGDGRKARLRKLSNSWFSAATSKRMHVRKRSIKVAEANINHVSKPTPSSEFKLTTPKAGKKLTVLTASSRYVSLREAMKFCSERLRNLHIWSDEEALKNLTEPPQFYENLRESFTVNVNVVFLSTTVLGLLREYCKDCHMPIEEESISVNPTECLHSRKVWKWFAKLRLEESNSATVEALLVGSEADTFFCGLTASEVGASEDSRAIIRKFIGALETSKDALDIGLLAYENENGQIGWMVQNTRGLAVIP